jgi:hypothetical protein
MDVGCWLLAVGCFLVHFQATLTVRSIVNYKYGSPGMWRFRDGRGRLDRCTGWVYADHMEMVAAAVGWDTRYSLAAQLVYYVGA